MLIIFAIYFSMPISFFADFKIISLPRPISSADAAIIVISYVSPIRVTLRHAAAADDITFSLPPMMPCRYCFMIFVTTCLRRHAFAAALLPADVFAAAFLIIDAAAIAAARRCC